MKAPISVLLGAALLALTPWGTLPARASPASAPMVVDLNQASLEQLQGLPGIGLRKAQAIVALRKKRPFSRVTQLLEVKGIGKRTLERLKTHVRVGPVASVAGGKGPGSAEVAWVHGVTPGGATARAASGPGGAGR